MSTAILPDGSVVVRLPSQTVHVDVRTKAIHLRAASTRDELGGCILDSFPQAAVDRVRLIRATDSHYLLFLDLRSGRSLSLGEATSHDTAMMTARVVANVTRCKIEVSQGSHALPGPSDRFSAAITYDARLGKDGLPVDPFEAPTGRMPYPPEASFAVDEAPTVPPQASTTSSLDDADVDVEDPLELTNCRAASSEEAMLRVDSEELLVVPVPRTLISKTAETRAEEDSWASLDAEEERDPTLEDAFEILRAYAWDELVPDPQAETLPPRSSSTPG